MSIEAKVENHRTFFEAAKRTGLITVKRSPRKDLLQVWMAAELRDGPEEYSQQLLESICSCCFDGVSGRSLIVVLDAQNPDFELGRFNWYGSLEPI